jgi:hypothetical protein
MNDKVTQKINEELSKVKPTFLTGVARGMVLKSPESVRGAKKLQFWKAHAKFKIDPLEGTNVLKQFTSQHAMDRKPTQIRLYKGGLKFPESCPVCLGSVTHHEVIEATIRRLSMPKTVITTKMSVEEAHRVFTAAQCDRFWYVVSFSENHGVEDRGVFIENIHDDKAIGGLKFRVFLMNREYAKRFAELNNLKGKWLSTIHVTMRNLGFLGMILLGGFFIGMMYALYMGIKQGDWSGFGKGTTIVLSVIILIGLIISGYSFLEGEKGEPIISINKQKERPAGIK